MKTIYQTKVLVRFEGKYLLLRKIKDIFEEHNNGWEVSGGRIFENEKPQDAAIREVKEETGINCKILTELKFLELEKKGIKTRTHVFLAESNTSEVELSSEHSEFIWVNFEEIDNLDNVIYLDLLKWYVLEANKL